MRQRVPEQRQVRLNRSLVLGLGLLLLVEIGGGIAEAQEPTTRNEFWPEINVYITLKPKLRLFLVGTVSKAVEDGEIFNAQAFEAQFGAHLDYLPNKHIILRTGYRYGRSLEDDSYREHRLLTEQTFRKMLPGNLLLSDRNREDFRFLKGDFSFRYRNRVTIEREFQLKRRTITPYVSGELFYDTRYGIWNRNRLNAGVQTSLRKGPILKLLLPKRQIVLDLYYTHQNDSRSSPSQVNALGAALAFYF
ncbi:MAG TPA: DUF2490 domain-containing protein [Blastocatellia bacterium]|nr:DUF2490 domain-containing protein [Blastocatellia bacterium]